MSRNLLISSALAAALVLTACGGGGGNSDTGGSGGTTPPPPVVTPTRSDVSGPLDAVQDPVSSSIFGGLADATAGTPLEGVVICADYAITHDTLDIADALALALQTAAADPSQANAALNSIADDMSLSVNQLAADLQGLLNALAGTGGCTQTTGRPTGGAVGTNPLAGTPLAALGSALAPVLGNVGAVSGGSGGSGGDDANLTSVAGLVSQLNAAFQTGYATVPQEARDAPVVGAVLAALSTALNDLNSTVSALGVYNGPATADSVATLVDHLLVNVLTNVVPITFIEDQSGQGPIISGQIITAVHQLSAALEGGMQQVATPLADLLSGQLSPLLDPIENDVLAPLLAVISGGIAGSGGTNPFAGTPLAALGDALAAVTDGLDHGGTGGTTGTPIDVILDPIIAVITGGGVGNCPVANTPLAALCDVADGLLGALEGGGGGDPTDLLTGVIDTILGLLGLG